MNRILIFLFISLLGTLFSCKRIRSEELPQEVEIVRDESVVEAEKVELHELISDIKKWDSVVVETQGTFVFEYENIALYESFDEDPDKVGKKAVWTNFDDRFFGKISLEDYSGKKIKVRGTVTRSQGHLMQYAGTLEDIYYIALSKDE